MKCPGIFLTIVFAIFLVTGNAQEKKDLTLEDIIVNRTFSSKSVRGINWMKDGRYFTRMVRNDSGADIVKYDITTGEEVETLVSGADLVPEGSEESITYSSYSFSPDENKLLFTTERESIYRRSYLAEFYVYDLETKSLVKLSPNGKQAYATFSPDASRVAFTRENDLFTVSLADMSETRLTHTGLWNETINGSADWVYEEELSLTKAFAWSPGGNMIAYYTFDESHVKEFNMQKWGDLYPEDYKFKYPKAGEENSIVTISILNLDNGKTVSVDLGSETDIYIPRIKWTNDPGTLSLLRLNRLQNHLEILHADAATGKTKVILSERSKTYIEINDDLTYLEDNSFIITSSRNGYRHVYHHRADGQLIDQLTSGGWEVSSFYGLDQRRGIVYYSSTEDSPLERQVYSVTLRGKKKKKLSISAGTNSANFSTDFRFYILTHSSTTSPPVYSLYSAPSGKIVKVLEDNKVLAEDIKDYNVTTREFFTFKTPESIQLNGYMLKPPDFDESKKYPVLIYVYGGPGSQTVRNGWGGVGWHNLLAQEGYIVVSVDNRGTGGRGRDFQHATYPVLGKLEVEDQISTARYLASLPYVEASRIGIWGWSYGGYMSSLALFVGNEEFKTAIAVAPVTSWRYYDTIYTERYVKRPQENADGYDSYSPITHVDKLKGNLLVVHGTGDDNVHYQNAVHLIDALIDSNKQFSTFYYPNRAHGISGGNTRLHLYTMLTNFIINNL